MFEAGKEPSHILGYSRGSRIWECLRCRAVLSVIVGESLEDRVSRSRLFRMGHDFCGEAAPDLAVATYVCPRCFRESHHPDDLKNRYCACCGSEDGSLPTDCPHREERP